MAASMASSSEMGGYCVEKRRGLWLGVFCGVSMTFGQWWKLRFETLRGFLYINYQDDLSLRLLSLCFECETYQLRSEARQWGLQPPSASWKETRLCRVRIFSFSDRAIQMSADAVPIHKGKRLRKSAYY